MLQLGNLKLGAGFWQWSIPAKDTCPGSTSLCRGCCYAAKGRFVFGSVQRALAKNLELTKSEDFVAWMRSELRHNDVRRLRLHVSGDFYDQAYLDKWVRIVESAPHVLFLAYTRSWHAPRTVWDPSTLAASLRRLNAAPNMRLWLSCDAETGKPPDPYRGLRRAYMAMHDDDAPRFGIDLAFRVDHSAPLKFDKRGNLVCPYEQGVVRKARINCTTCKLCWRDEPIPKRKLPA